MPGPGRFPRNLNKLKPPAGVLEIAARLRRAGYAAYAVGGAVRDALLGLDHLDWDLATSARPEEVRKLFKRTVPVGIEFGTIGVLDGENVMHEVTTFRRDVRTDGRHAVVEFGASLDEDLARRDFTINAIALDPDSNDVHDPFDGQGDLKRGIVRAVGVPDDRMREDRLRALRAIRFASRFTFHIEPKTWDAIKGSAPHLGRLSPERVKQELEKTMKQVDHPSVALEWWRESGALKTLIPVLATAPPERFAGLDRLQRDDEGKDHGRTLNRLSMLFFGDEPRAVRAATKALRFSNADAEWISRIAECRAELGEEVDRVLEAGAPSAVQVRTWVARIGRTRTDSFFRLNNALLLSKKEHAGNSSLADRLAELQSSAVSVAYRDPIEIADLAVDGEDLRTLGVPAGPRMGRMLKALLDRVVADPALNTRETLLKLASDLRE